MSHHVLIIAEAGVNHNGSLELAKQLIDKAVDAGVDIIKFQTFKSEKLVSKAAKQAEYQQRNIGKNDEGQLLKAEEEQNVGDHHRDRGAGVQLTAGEFFAELGEDGQRQQLRHAQHGGKHHVGTFVLVGVLEVVDAEGGGGAVTDHKKSHC